MRTITVFLRTGETLTYRVPKEKTLSMFVNEMYKDPRGLIWRSDDASPEIYYPIHAVSKVVDEHA